MTELQRSLVNASTADLVLELRRRFPALLFSGVKVSTANTLQKYVSWKGDGRTVAHLLNVLGDEMAKTVDRGDFGVGNSVAAKNPPPIGGMES